MKAYPYYRMWVKDFDTDENVRLMNLKEAGLYLFCLNHAWTNDGLPESLDDIARAIKVPPAVLKRLWMRVGKNFFADGFGRLRNPKQEQERGHAIAKSEANQRYGNANAAIQKRERVSENHEKNANGSQHARARADSGSVSDVSSSEEGCGGKPELVPNWKTDRQFCAFVTGYMELGKEFLDEDYADAYQFAWKRLNLGDCLDRMAGLKRLSPEYAADPRYIPKPRKFIEVEWKRPSKPAPKRKMGVAESVDQLILKRLARGQAPL